MQTLSAKELLNMSQYQLIKEIVRLREENRRLALQVRWLEDEVNHLIEYKYWFHGHPNASAEAGVAVEEIEQFS